MWPTAAAPCSIPVEASPGGPSTSPAAYTPGTLVIRFSSTRTRPRSSTMTPAASSPSPCVFGLRPAAKRYVSTSNVSPVGRFRCLSLSWISMGLLSDGGTLKSPTTVENLRFTPDSRRSSLRAVAMSLSIPTLSIAALKDSSRTMRVTFAPSFVKIFAYSIAMIPAPVMATEEGRYDSSLIESLLNTRRASKGIPSAWKAEDPVAMRNLSAATGTVFPFLSCSSTVFGEVKAALACTLGTATPRRRRTVFCVSTSAISLHISWTCDQMLLSLIPIAFSSATSTRAAVSLRALLKRPVGPPSWSLAPLPGSSTTIVSRPP
mmetsp:Transcript_21122/g.51682  ORF Transcript_21122/g.51682 Transcript_21122/m.51682 type:complete len:319 (-) Transcript_21122:501-1457(-)